MQQSRRFTDLEPAGFVRRATAFIVDVAIVYVAVVVLLQAVLDPVRDMLGPGWARVGWFYVAYSLLTVSLPVWLYFAGYEAGDDRATYGKRWLGIVVTGADGGEISFGRALLRTFLKLLPFEVAHIAVTVPANPFIDPLSGAFVLPAGDDLAASTIVGVLVALLALGVGLLILAINADRRAPHDLLAGTFVMESGTTRVARAPGAAGEAGLTS